MMTSVLYDVEHQTRYVHAGRVSTSRHLGYLTPRMLPRQAVHRHAISIDPHPADCATRHDVFGNSVTQFSILTPYIELGVTSRSLVEVWPRSPSGQDIDPEASLAWEDVRESGVFRANAPCDEAAEFRYRSPYVELAAELADFARPALTPRRPLLAAAIGLMHRIHDEFRFDAGATSVTTPVSRVLAERGGVCQDFAHLQIACLRSFGLAARYVSGYLLTDPPPGQNRLVGADASHAWLSVWCPPYGWVDLDPTNAVLPDWRHVTTAWGRDYGDVSPLRGVVLGSADHELYVGVSVVPVHADKPPSDPHS
jgi:transglutaminase-like putative cysteine protease